ncbi:MAG: LysR family transcriptional regulator [Intestinimonas sp.]|jgi:DNA-binding transcriptional LysR family regulator|nr:LysR family transcriptional regulator [Intestinimonas sp.]
MDIIHLRYFQTIAQQKSLTRAAKLLHISQPALSASLSKLEKELDVQLFDRVGRHIELNEYGKIYIDYVNQALDCLGNAVREIENRKYQCKQKLTISSVSLPFIQDVLTEFTQSHPNVTVRAYEVMMKDIKSELNNSDCDFVITASDGMEDFGENYQIIKREKFYLAVNRSHHLAERQHVKLSELKDEAFVSLPRGYSFREITDKLCRDSGFSCQVFYECFHCRFMDYIRNGLAIAFVTEQVPGENCECLNSDGQIVFLNIDDQRAYRSIALQWNGKKVMSSVAKELLEHVRRVCKRPQSLA